jgi:hypothetical protein
VDPLKIVEAFRKTKFQFRIFSGASLKKIRQVDKFVCCDALCSQGILDANIPEESQINQKRQLHCPGLDVANRNENKG